MFKTDLQKVQYLDKYARWNETLGRRESWDETVDRVMNFFHSTTVKHGVENVLSREEMAQLRQGMMNLDVLPSMRIVQMAGPALERCNVGAYNCAYLPLKDWRAFSELLYILMQGTGCGFSVEQQYVDQLPVIQPQKGNGILNIHVVADTTDGWCNALEFGLKNWAAGSDVSFDYAEVRPYGAPLKTKGGKASGPEPLKNLLDFARKLLLEHQGRKLSSLNAHDLACYCGSIVQVGGVRRSAEISLSDFDDDRMAKAKRANFWDLAPERAMANNSAVYNSKPTMGKFMAEWTRLMESGTGERGIFNRGSLYRQIPERRAEDHTFGLNPCGEIVLRPFEFCNLSIAVARPNDGIADLTRKVRLAAKFGVIQSLLTDFNYIRPDWAVNCQEERLLGVDITGQMDCPMFSYDAENVYSQLRDVAVSEATRLSERLGIPQPAAVTCVKPSGNSSQLLDVSSGIHPRFSEFYIRRLRIGSSSPVSKLLIDAGVPHFPEVGQPPDNPTVWVFEFPVESPVGARTRAHTTALGQLNQWLLCKRFYTEHNPSCTVYIKDDEWMEVGAWVYKNWHSIGGLSFLPYDGGVYQLAPYEAIDVHEYNRRVKAWPKIDFTKLDESTDTTELNREYACSGDRCEI